MAESTVSVREKSAANCVLLLTSRFWNESWIFASLPRTALPLEVHIQLWGIGSKRLGRAGPPIRARVAHDVRAWGSPGDALVAATTNQKNLCLILCSA